MYFNIIEVLLMAQAHGEGCEGYGKPPMFMHTFQLGVEKENTA